MPGVPQWAGKLCRMPEILCASEEAMGSSKTLDISESVLASLLSDENFAPARPATLEEDTRHEGAALDLEVRSRHDGMQIRPCGT